MIECWASVRLEGIYIAFVIHSLDEYLWDFSEVTHNIALRWSADIGRITILLTLHSSGVRDKENLYQGMVYNSWPRSEKPVFLAE